MNNTRKRILYADDEDALLHLAKRTLSRQGYSVTPCADPRQALELFEKSPAAFDLVITDLSMPYLTGLELVENLRALRADIPVIMTSGCVREEDRVRAAQLGIRDLLLKPVSASDLRDALERALKL